MRGAEKCQRIKNAGEAARIYIHERLEQRSAWKPQETKGLYRMPQGQPDCHRIPTDIGL